MGTRDSLQINNQIQNYVNLIQLRFTLLKSINLEIVWYSPNPESIEGCEPFELCVSLKMSHKSIVNLREENEFFF